MSSRISPVYICKNLHCCSDNLILAKNVYLKTLIETQSLALSEIETLYSHSDQYIIPYIQRETERRAMVLYNTYQREKSVEEARIMHQGLEKAGFKSSSIEWTNALQLPKILYEKIHENVQTTSVLFVCIMSHGSAGMILGKDSSWMPISDILTLLGNVLPEYLPLVSMPSNSPVTDSDFSLHLLGT